MGLLLYPVSEEVMTMVCTGTGMVRKLWKYHIAVTRSTLISSGIIGNGNITGLSSRLGYTDYLTMNVIKSLFHLSV